MEPVTSSGRLLANPHGINSLNIPLPNPCPLFAPATGQWYSTMILDVELTDWGHSDSSMNSSIGTFQSNLDNEPPIHTTGCHQALSSDGVDPRLLVFGPKTNPSVVPMPRPATAFLTMNRSQISDPSSIGEPDQHSTRGLPRGQRSRSGRGVTAATSFSFSAQKETLPKLSRINKK